MQSGGYLKLRSGTVIRGYTNEAEGHSVDLTPQVAEHLGYAFAVQLAKRYNTTTDKLVVVVGHDSRDSSPVLHKAFMHGLTDADSDVLDCGECSSPALLHAMRSEETHGAVMITASNHAWYENGFRISLQDGEFSEAEITQLLLQAEKQIPPMRLVKPMDSTAGYEEKLRAAVECWMDTDVQYPLLGLHVIVDAGGGSGGFVSGFLESLGCEVTGSMGLTPDAHKPVKTQAFDNSQALSVISEVVRENTADIGILMDADGDRAVIVDEKGRAINGNRLIALISAILLEKNPGATIVTDSVTSSGLQKFITEWGGIHYRFKRGYQNVIREAIRLNEEDIDCPLAIETSGHAAFRDNGFMDDGLYLAMRLLCEALLRKRDGETLGALIDDLSEPVENAEIRFQILTEECREATQAVVETVLSYTLKDSKWHLAKDNREGVRILFDLEGGVENAWFQIRQSVHDPVLVLYAESDVHGGVVQMLRQLYDILQAEDVDEVDLTPLKEAVEQDQ